MIKGYEIDTSNNKDLIFKINHIFTLMDNCINRSIVHLVREQLENLSKIQKEQEKEL